MSQYTGSSGWNMNGAKISSLADPSSAQDAATKNYVDSTAQGLDWKASVRAASTANVTLSSPGSTLDGVTLAVNDRVLLRAQSAPAENGLYTWTGSAVALTRTTDANTSGKVSSGLVVSVEEGTTYADKAFMLVTDGAITLGTTGLSFSSFGSGSTYSAGNGLSLSSGAFAVVPNGSSLDVSSSGVKLSQSSAGNGIAVSATGVISNAIGTGLVNSGGSTIVDRGVIAFWASNAGTHSASSTLSLTHSIGRLSYTVSVCLASTGEEIYADVTKSTTSVSVAFSSVQAANSILITVVG